MRRYHTTAVAEPAAPTKAPRPRTGGDITRAHAANWAAAVGILALCGGILAWAVAKSAGAPVDAGELGLVPLVAIGAAGVAFAVKLIRFTEEHRDWIYRIEEATGLDLDGDGYTGLHEANPAGHPDGALVRGVDGALHRVDVALSPQELQGVKRHLLTAGAYTVRAVNELLGDETRASALRVELHRLGILEQPKPRAATRLTAPGRKTVMRWA